MRQALPVALCPVLLFVATLGAQSPRTVWDGVYSDAQAKRGRELYSSKCLSCHGADLLRAELVAGFRPDGLPGGEIHEARRMLVESEYA